MNDNSYTETILIVEDEKGLVKVLKAYLEKEGFEVFSSYDGHEGLKLFYEKNPDLIILDLMLPRISGENIARRIRQTNNTPIIMLTAKGKEDEKLEGLGLGADDYVVKPVSPREITARVKTILRRTKNDSGRVQKDIIEAQNLTIDTLSHKIYLKEDKNSYEIFLTPTEYEILKHLALYPKKVFSRENLADIVFGYFWEKNPRTIDTHIKNLRRKIEPDPKNPTIIKTIFGTGYQFQDKNNHINDLK